MAAWQMGGFGGGKGKGMKGASSWGKPAWGAAPAAPAWGGMAKGVKGGAFGGGKMGGKGDMMKGMKGMMKGMMGDMKGKGKGKSKTPGHKLPRERITEAPVIGEVIEWKGKYGWLQPSEPIQHEKAGKREGKIFVGKDDIVGGSELEAGKLVQFHVFSDPAGLGAEEVLQG
eukprot:CAMPEP_0197626476 /NCGR_PEP_ID=MMETSP1338-20131121/5428_1 /TAXON_ID=43686 ORGANISM="Pelagodinium beii, Strain RCC1491" /NCGR_SAMPLE_ID=MMETSP1338 /ASSEMBLY_ACC=CAM_ASM_000754 /LENGTH=170 /DNA_ID=CAMNT_0043197017 /DNA_START=61 /DNA_END=573 /DNA_ORIENTATION=-